MAQSVPMAHADIAEPECDSLALGTVRTGHCATTGTKTLRVSISVVLKLLVVTGTPRSEQSPYTEVR